MLRRLEILPRLYLPLIVALCAAYAWRPLRGGYDFWAHAAVGRWIWNHMEVPTRTLFLWSADIPWVAHSWLSQLFFYGLLQGGEGLGAGRGPFVVIIFSVVMCTIPFVLLWRLWARRVHSRGEIATGGMTVFAPLLFALAIWCSAPRFQPRQELFSVLFLVLVLAFLIAWSEGRLDNARPTGAPHAARSSDIIDPLSFGLVLLFALWVNLHALFAVGLMMLALTVVADGVQDRFDRRWRALAVLAVLCAAATLVNPWNIDIWEAIAPLKPGNLAHDIDEWQPPLWEAGLRKYVAGEAILVLAALWAWWRNPQRRWAQLLWVLTMSALFLRQQRHLWLLAIVCLAVMAANARSFDTQAMWKAWRRRTRQPELLGIPAGLQRVAQAGTIFILMVTVAIAVPHDIWPLHAIWHRTPVRAAAEIERRNLPGRLFNDYENSSYLQWALNGPVRSGPLRGRVLSRGRRPLYIDLLNAYPDGPRGLLAEYFQFMDATPVGRRLLDERGINTVILGAHKRRSRLARYLSGAGKAQWVKIYDRPDSIIWTRRTPRSVPKTAP